MVCPMRDKGYDLEVSCRLSLGDGSQPAHNEETRLNLPIGALPFNAARFALCNYAMISDVIVYERLRLNIICHWIKSQSDFVHVTCSLVPFMRGQWLQCSFSCMSDDFKPISVDCASLSCIDLKNDHMLDVLPHGRASDMSIELAPRTICNFLEFLLERTGLRVYRVFLGQGLIELRQVIKEETERSTVSRVAAISVDLIGSTQHGPVDLF